MTRPKKIFLVGHSHSNCIAAALKTGIEGVSEYKHLHLSIADRYIKSGNPTMPLDELHDKTLHLIKRDLGELVGHSIANERDLPGHLREHNVLAVMTIRGVSHVLSGLVRSARPYDVVLPQEPHLPLDREADLVPYDALRAHYAAMMAGSLQLIEKIGAMLGPAVVCAAFPPVPGDDDFIYGALGKYFHEKYKNGFKIVTPMLRHKLWRMCTSLHEDACAPSNVRFFPAPPETFVDGLYLNPKAYYTDAVHANEWYGERMMRSILDAQGS